MLNREHLGCINTVNKAADIVIGRCAQHFFRCIKLDHASVPQNAHAASQLKCLIDVMSNEDNGLSRLLLDAQQLKLEIIFHKGIKGGKGFIHEQDIRVACQGPGDTNALPHPAGQTIKTLPFVPFKTHHANHFKSLGLPFRLLDAADFKTIAHIAHDIPMSEKTAVLEDHGNFCPPQLLKFYFIVRSDIFPVNEDFSPAGPMQHIEAAHKGRFAAARQPYKYKDFSFSHPKGHVRHSRRHPGCFKDILSCSPKFQ